jgi:hypothetical protein
MHRSAQHRPGDDAGFTREMQQRLKRIGQQLNKLANARSAHVARQSSRAKDSGIWSDILKSLIPSLVILFATYEIKDSVDMALQERQLQLQNVQAMTSLETALQDPTIDPTKATNDAVQLAAFGRYSTPFFINVLEVGLQTQTNAAEQGLRMVSRSEPEEVCGALVKVVSNHTGLYRWTTHLTALKLLGEASCKSDQGIVSDYVKQASSLTVYQKWVAPLPKPEQSEYDRIVSQANDTESRLESAPSEHWWQKLQRGGKSR